MRIFNEAKPRVPSHRMAEFNGFRDRYRQFAEEDRVPNSTIRDALLDFLSDLK